MTAILSRLLPRLTPNRPAIAAILAAGALAACGGSDVASRTPSPSGTLSNPAIPQAGIIALSDLFTGSFDLVDVAGRPVTDEAYLGRVPVIYFGFASCPDVCPLALGRLGAALAQLDDAERARLAPLFITVDPARDTPAVLRDYLQNFPGINGLTGSEEQVSAAKQGLKVYSQKVPFEEGADGYSVDHTSFFYLIDPQGTPRYALHDTLTPDEIAMILRDAAAW